MKILHLLASPFFSGPAELVTQLALAQRALGHEVSIAVDRKRTTTTSEELIVPRLGGLLAEAPLDRQHRRAREERLPFGVRRDRRRDGPAGKPAQGAAVDDICQRGQLGGTETELRQQCGQPPRSGQHGVTATGRQPAAEHLEPETHT